MLIISLGVGQAQEPTASLTRSTVPGTQKVSIKDVHLVINFYKKKSLHHANLRCFPSGLVY